MKDTKKDRIAKIKKMSLENKRVKVFIIIAMFILFITVGVLLGINYNKQVHANVIYRTYTKEDGWSKWSKSGKISGKNGKNITAIQIKIKSKYNGHVFYDVYSNGKWQEKNAHDGVTAGNKKDAITGIRINITDQIFDRYSVYYSTHNKTDKWLLYNKNGYQSGNAKKGIDMIKIKVSFKDDSNYEKIEMGNTRYKNFD